MASTEKTKHNLFVRNLPFRVVNKIRRYAREKRTTLAGVIIELFEFAESSHFFKDENNH